MSNVWRKAAAGALCFVFFASMLGAGAGAQAGENRKGEITEEKGSTANWGGGDYYFVKFGPDAAFGVMWGNDTNPNSIQLITVHSRYLGVAEVYDTNGAKVARQVPIRIFQTFGTKLLDIFEFNDTNGDGICNAVRLGDGLSYRDYIAHEPIYKAASLSTSWKASDVTKTENETSKSYEFTLTAQNLGYRAIGNSTTISDAVANERLDRVQFTMHLSAGLVYVDGVAVPHYKVTVEKAGAGRMARGYEVVGSERLDDLNYTGNRGQYAVKWDHEIAGWDFDPTNQNNSLLMEWAGFAAYAIPEKVDEWLNVQFVKRTGGEGNATYRDDSGTVRNAGGADDSYAPRKIGAVRHIEFGGNWTKVGRFTWMSECTVDGKSATMYSQVQGGKPFEVVGERGRMVGFAVLGGFSYPGGSTVYHDPGIDGTVLVDVVAKPKLPIGLIVIAGIAAVAAVAGVLMVASRRARKKETYEGSYDRAERKDGGQEGWSEYYSRK